MNKPLILLDRDGTLIMERAYLKDPEKVRLLPGVAAGLRRLSRAGLPLVVITNQSGVGRRLMKRRDVGRVHRRLEKMLQAKGIRLSGIYWCPHRPGAGCACRKPRLKLVRQAARDLQVKWRRSLSIGDKWSDVALGQRTGGGGILVLTGYGRDSLKSRTRHRPADFVAADFKTAAQWVIKKLKL